MSPIYEMRSATFAECEISRRISLVKSLLGTFVEALPEAGFEACPKPSDPGFTRLHGGFSAEIAHV
jgi:hypothetical protein